MKLFPNTVSHWKSSQFWGTYAPKQPVRARSKHQRRKRSSTFQKAGPRSGRYAEDSLQKNTLTHNGDPLEMRKRALFMKVSFRHFINCINGDP
jgi:hypothetical protein